MTRADCPPGHRIVKFGSGTHAHPAIWSGEPGDVVRQRGPRIGTRLWLVINVDPLRVWSRVMLRRIDVGEYTEAITDGATVWTWEARILDLE